jgi:ACS family hexuronate transporter-like MFS transporter
MMGSASEIKLPVHHSSWKWWVCGLLLLATMINYMDRLTLNQMAPRIKDELRLSNEQYGDIEWAFGMAFATGAVLVGWTVDRWNVWWIYPTLLLGWSAAGFATGFARDFKELLLCRSVLGLFEAGNWPCALRTTQRILTSRQRTMGNSLLQSGAAIGAILTPLIVQVLVFGPGTWNRPFLVIGACGTVWIVLWLAIMRSQDLALPARPSTRPQSSERSLVQIFGDRRFWVCLVIAILMNATWHFFRVWMPLFLRQGRDYSESAVNYFSSCFYIATDAGCLAAGFATLLLARRGVSVHGSRIVVFFVCALLTSLSVIASSLPAGLLLLGLLLLIGFGALGLFPVYYSLSQELTIKHQGKLSGTLAFLTWTAVAFMHPPVGRWLDRTGDYSSAVALAGLAPLPALLMLLMLWPASRPQSAPIPSAD